MEPFRDTITVCLRVNSDLEERRVLLSFPLGILDTGRAQE